MKKKNMKFILWLIALFSFASCTEDYGFTPTKEKLKSEKHFKAYFTSVDEMTRLLRSGNSNDIKERSAQLKSIKKTNDTKTRNFDYIKYTESLKNEDGISYQELFKQAQYHYTKLLFKYVVKGKMRKEEFTMAFKNEIQRRFAEKKQIIQEESKNRLKTLHSNNK